MQLEPHLGSAFKVLCSHGPLRDFPESKKGFSASSYEPEYIVSRPAVVKKLKMLIGPQEVILATTPDREGEAAAWHMKEALGLKNYKRIDILEFTSDAVLGALNAPRNIDMNLVRAFEARRIMGRLVRFHVQRFSTIYPAEIRARSRAYGCDEPNPYWMEMINELLWSHEIELTEVAEGRANWISVISEFEGHLAHC
jgi:DNA topoisomerase IA